MNEDVHEGRSLHCHLPIPACCTFPAPAPSERAPIYKFMAFLQGGAVVKKEWQTSFLMQSLVLTKRSFVNMYRDLGYYWLRFAIYIMLCLCVGTIFYDIGHNYGSILVNKLMNVHHCESCSVSVVCMAYCAVLIPKINNYYCSICRLVAPCSISSPLSSPSWPSAASRLSWRT